MDTDDEKTKRATVLGFVPQKENLYNRLLPYSDLLDEESVRLYTDIKTNLVKAFLAREIRPGCALWTARLHKYMKIYGFKFSKEDHVCFIKMFYELLTIPNLEPTRINKFAGTLIYLLKKRRLLSREDLQLEWRPLYDLYTKISEKGNVGLGMYRYYSTLSSALAKVIKSSRTYFPVSATQEILDELRPKLYPFSSSDIIMTIDSLQLFLPLTVKPSEAYLGYELWFKEFMQFWESCHNASLFENNMTWLMSALAHYNIGFIDWEPYVPLLFARFTRAMQLPVSYRQKSMQKVFKIESTAMATWIVSVLGGPSDTAFLHLEQFMQTLETYFNSSNVGRWTMKLKDFCKKLCYYFVMRLHRERYAEKTWMTEVPDDHKLTEGDIDRFVNLMKPCVDHMIHSLQQDALIFNYLASLRPNVIIPMILDKLYESMDSLTKPHRFTSALISITAVSRYIVQGRAINYPEGPTHIIPLLHNILPGIDPNDIRKSFTTFNFILQMSNMIPYVNSTGASEYHTLTEEEHMVCEATSGFEDFILQLVDRLCVWIESTSVEITRLEQINDVHRHESASENGVVTVMTSVMQQTPPVLFTQVLKKMYTFATTHIFEIKVSGRMVASVIRSLGKINEQETAKAFIPYLCDTIEGLLGDNDDVLKEETLSEELLYNMLLLSEAVDLRSELINYIARLTKVLDRLLLMTSIQGNQLATKTLKLMLLSLTSVVVTEARSSTTPYDTHIKDFLSIREWGKAPNIKDLDIKWYVPGEAEIQCAQMLLHRYLVPELEKLNRYAKGEQTLTRELLRNCLYIVWSSLGCLPALPLWKEPAMNLMESVLEPWAFELIVGPNGSIEMPDGSNVRKTVADCLHNVQKRILQVDESDTKSVNVIISIYDKLLFNKSTAYGFEIHWKNFHTTKALLEDILHQKKKHLRHVLIDRAMLHQEFRSDSRSCTFTETHKQILLDLFELSICHYSDIRKCAQKKVFMATDVFAYSYSVLLPHMVDILKMDTIEHHEKFKGCLYVLIGQKTRSILVKHDWELIRDLWPALVTSKSSEKLSIVNMIDYCVDHVHKMFPTIAVNLTVSDESLKFGYVLADQVPKIDLTGFKKNIDEGAAMLQKRSDKNLQAYNETITLLLDAAESNKLHWRYHLMAVSFLRDLVHPDVKYENKVVNFFLSMMINDSIKIRKIAMKVMLFILRQNRLEYKKVKMDLSKLTNNKHLTKVAPGIREDNMWLLYNSNTAPRSSEEWNENRFVHYQYWGFYCWPKELECYAPANEQPNVSDHVDAMSEQQRAIYNFFMNSSNVDELIRYYSMEEKKGNDKFNTHRLIIFKMLFKLFEDKLLDAFMPKLMTLVSDAQEQNHRCAAEIIGGIISGCKHWNFEKSERLWTELIPVLRTAFNNLSIETVSDWGSTVAIGLHNRDPNRYHWLLEFLMNDPLKESSSFLSCCRILLMNCAYNQQIWRHKELCKRNLDYFMEHMMHPFQNVREKISLTLVNVFCIGPDFGTGGYWAVPELFTKIKPTLDSLLDSALNKFDHTNHRNDNNVVVNHVNGSTGNNDEKEPAIRLFKIVATFVSSSLLYTVYSLVPEHLILLPLACVFQSNDVDEELTSVCTAVIAAMGSTVIPAKHVPPMLETIDKVANCPFWSARAVIAEFIPVFVFHKMSIVNSSREWVHKIEAISLKLLEDPQPEVRMKASDIISGFMHCNFIKDQAQLLAEFRVKAKTKLSNTGRSPGGSSRLRVRHAGVLGLCCYINAHPYDIPDDLPGIFGELGPHLNDPQPIPATIIKTLGDFKRTHYSNWEQHKLKFTEDELLVFSDLTVPPSYYA